MCRRNLVVSRVSTVLLSAVLCGPASGDTLATVTAEGGAIELLTDRCSSGDRRIQRAIGRLGGVRLDGCWSVNAHGNPVVLWGDGRVQEIDASRVRLAARYAAMLEDEPAPAARERGPAEFPRASWCANARFPHERLVCRDPELASADLALAPLWRAYRRHLTEVQQGQVKSEYFRRLKACGANKPCIRREQAAQARFYREGLAER